MLHRIESKNELSYLFRAQNNYAKEKKQKVAESREQEHSLVRYGIKSDIKVHEEEKRMG